ncbi:MAG: hypothetical protein KY468_04205 [Armatimonadetes bacterium]|nr:hypothetical protein [Armatimonadota bacterium]
MSIKDRGTQKIDHLSEAELEQVADYLAFLKFRSRRHTFPQVDPAHYALYAEFAEEDRLLAEDGMGEYAKGLAREDAA